jgi:hypothetical protein
VYSTVTSKVADSIEGEFNDSAPAIDNFETRVVQQFAEFFTGICWVVVGRYKLIEILKMLEMWDQTFEDQTYPTLYINIQFVHHRGFTVLKLKRPMDDCRTRQIIVVCF